VSKWRPFANEVKIEIAKKEWKSVRVADFERLAGLGAALNFVAAGFGRGGLIRRPDRLEESLGPEFDGVGNFCGGDDGFLKTIAGFGGPGNEKPDGPSGGDGMRAENTELGRCLCRRRRELARTSKSESGVRFGRQRRWSGDFGVFREPRVDSPSGNGRNASPGPVNL